MLRFGTYREPSKAELREMLADAFRNTEAKKAAVAPPIAPEVIDESALEELALALVEAVPAIEEAPAPPKRDFLYVDPPPPPKRYYAGSNVQPYHLEHGSPEQMALLEDRRLVQERAWFRKGYSREEIIRWFGRWPTDHGYPAYEWKVGYPWDHGVTVRPVQQWQS